MDGAPRIPMLTSEFKYAMASVDFGPKIREYIAKNYGEDPAAYDKSVADLNALRETVCRSSCDGEGCALLKRYVAQLMLLRNRVPMEEGDEAAIAFSWLDKGYDLPNPGVFEDINYEIACVMHNVGAMHSQVATLESRVTLDSIKTAFTHYQYAAWAFQYVADKLTAAKYSVDFAPPALNFFAQLMLVQAQECILEKSLIDHRKHVIIAKIARQAANMYQQLVDLLSAAATQAVMPTKDFVRWCQIKQCYYTAVAFLYSGQEADEQQQMGVRLAWYRASAEKFNECIKSSDRERTAELKDTIKFVRDVIAAKYENGLKENNFIYHEHIPDFDSLPEIKGVCLVKPVGFDPLDPQVSGADFFQTLVPLRVHSANSLYSERKDALLRKYGQKCEQKNAELDEFMSSLRVSELGLAEEQDDGPPLPEALLERSAAFNADHDAVPRVLDSIQLLTGCYQEADQKLTQLQMEWRQVDEQLRAIKLPAGSPNAGRQRQLRDALDELEALLQQYADKHKQATGNNTELQRAVAGQSESLKILALPLSQLKKQLPAPSAQANASPEAEELRRLLAKVDEMSRQRSMLLDQLRQQLHNDDLTNKLLAMKNVDTKELFDEELHKHTAQLALLDQNLTAQANVVNALVAANANFADARKLTVDTLKARTTKIMSLLTAYDVYADVAHKAEQGRQFYVKYLQKLRAFAERLDEQEETIGQLAVETAGERQQLADKQHSVPSTAAQAGQPPAPAQPPAAGGGGGRERREGARLADYMQYYRAKQAGLNPTAPLSLQQPAATDADVADMSQQMYSMGMGVAPGQQSSPAAMAQSYAAAPMPTQSQTQSPMPYQQQQQPSPQPPQQHQQPQQQQQPSVPSQQPPQQQYYHPQQQQQAPAQSAAYSPHVQHQPASQQHQQQNYAPHTAQSVAFSGGHQQQQTQPANTYQPQQQMFQQPAASYAQAPSSAAQPAYSQQQPATVYSSAPQQQAYQQQQQPQMANASQPAAYHQQPPAAGYYQNSGPISSSSGQHQSVGYNSQSTTQAVSQSQPQPPPVSQQQQQPPVSSYAAQPQPQTNTTYQSQPSSVYQQPSQLATAYQPPQSQQQPTAYHQQQQPNEQQTGYQAQPPASSAYQPQPQQQQQQPQQQPTAYQSPATTYQQPQQQQQQPPQSQPNQPTAYQPPSSTYQPQPQPQQPQQQQPSPWHVGLHPVTANLLHHQQHPPRFAGLDEPLQEAEQLPAPLVPAKANQRPAQQQQPAAPSAPAAAVTQSHQPNVSSVNAPPQSGYVQSPSPAVLPAAATSPASVGSAVEKQWSATAVVAPTPAVQQQQQPASTGPMPPNQQQQQSKPTTTVAPLDPFGNIDAGLWAGRR